MNVKYIHANIRVYERERVSVAGERGGSSNGRKILLLLLRRLTQPHQTFTLTVGETQESLMKKVND